MTLETVQRRIRLITLSSNVSRFSRFWFRTLNLRESLFARYRYTVHGKLPGMNLLKRRNEP